MVNISKQGDHYLFEIQGMHKLRAFKNQIAIPASHVVRAHRDMETISGFKGGRFPGTSISGKSSL